MRCPPSPLCLSPSLSVCVSGWVAVELVDVDASSRTTAHITTLSVRVCVCYCVCVWVGCSAC